MQEFQLALKNISSTDKPCVTFDNGSASMSLTYAQVIHLASVINSYLNSIPEKTLVNFRFDLNSPDLVYLIPALLAVSLNSKLCFSINHSNEESETSEIISEEYAWRISLKKLCPELPKDIVYFVSTSGTISSARKTVGVPCSCFWTNVKDFNDVFRFSETDVIFSAAPPTFDPFYLDVFSALTSNACILLTSQNVKAVGGDQLASILDRNNVTFSQMTPSLFTNLTSIPKSLSKLVLGGEPFPKLDALGFKLGKVELYNVYGLTEMSVWQSLTKITNLTEEEQPILDGTNLLSATEISLRDSTNEELLHQDGIYGEIWIESAIRGCYFEGKVHNSFNTKDVGIFKNGKLYCRGRTDDVFKIHGRRVSMREVEHIWSQHYNAPAYGIWDDKRFLRAYVRSSETIQILEDRASIPIPTCMQPFSVIVSHEDVPRNENGKLDRKTLRKIIMDASQASASQDLSLAWKRFSGRVPVATSNFLLDGGDSYSAILLAEYLAEQYSLQASQTTEMINVVLSKTYKDLIDLTTSLSGPKRKVSSHEMKPINALHEIEARKEAPPLLWKQNMKKCIDASPILVGDSVIIGSHRGLFAAFDVKIGVEHWQLQLDDRIEATATASLNGSCVFIGTYAGTFYCIDCKSGSILWKNKDAEDLIKSKASVTDTLVLFGSHDGKLRCLSIGDGSVVWSCDLGGPVVAATVIYSDEHVIASTLKGACHKLSLSTGKIVASTNLDSPIFSSPSLVGPNIIIASVRGIAYCLSSNLETLWVHQCSGHIFAPLAIRNDLSFIATKSGLIIALDSDGNEKWSQSMQNPITAACCHFGEKALIAVDNKSNVMVVDVENGKSIKEYGLQIGETFSAPVVVDDKMIIGSRNDELYCYLLCDT